MDEIFEIVDRYTNRRLIEVVFPSELAAHRYVETWPRKEQRSVRVQSVRMYNEPMPEGGA